MPSTLSLNCNWGEARTEKFGRVVFSNSSGKGEFLSTNPYFISPIRLSNLDLKWYTWDGAIHPAYAKNLKSPVSLKCSLSLEDKYGSMCAREMRFLVPETLGNIAGPAVGLVDAVNGKLVELAADDHHRHRGGGGDEMDHLTIKALEVVSLAAFCGVGKSSDPNTVLQVLWALVFVWKDFVDNSSSCNNNEDDELPQQYEQLSKIISYMIDILCGNDDLSSVEEMSSRSLVAVATVKKYEGFFHLLRRVATKTSERYGSSPSPALDAIIEFLPSTLLQKNCTEEWRKALRGAVDLDTCGCLQRANRETRTGVIPSLEWFALFEGIAVKDSIRQSWLFKQFRSMVARHVTLVNDLFSYAKEYASGEVSNVIYQHHVEGGCSMEESLAWLERETNQVSEAMTELGDLLLRLYRKDDGLERFVRLGKAVAYGHLQWYSYSHRYYPELVFDMIVH